MTTGLRSPSAGSEAAGPALSRGFLNVLGIALGTDLNPAWDNLSFALLMKHARWFGSPAKRRERAGDALDAFERATTAGGEALTASPPARFGVGVEGAQHPYLPARAGRAISGPSLHPRDSQRTRGRRRHQPGPAAAVGQSIRRQRAGRRRPGIGIAALLGAGQYPGRGGRPAGARRPTPSLPPS